MRTNGQRLADVYLGEPVEQWIAARRPDTSWDRLAVELRDVTRHNVEVTAQTLRGWARATDEPVDAA
jgi:hypothetical protein